MQKKKRSFKLPHILYIVLGLLVVMSLLTYIIPAGQFGVDSNGNINANEFNYLGKQTPVSLVDLFYMIAGGLAAASGTIWIVLISGANMEVVLDTKAIDNVLNYATVKLKNKSSTVLVPILYFLILTIAAFASTDALIAVVPIGVLFAKKLRLDPMAALAVSFFPSVIGFGLGITIRVIPIQGLFGIAPLSGFGVRVLILYGFGLIGYLFSSSYIKKIQKDSSLSIMSDTNWQTEFVLHDEDDSEHHITPVRSFIVLGILLAQYLLLVVYLFVSADRPIEFMTAYFLVFSFILGKAGGLTFDEIAVSITKGISNMALVGFIIGLASTMQAVMVNGNIMDTIVYGITRPLMELNKSLSAVGITAVITIINPLIPSAMAKGAALVPIVSPPANALGIDQQIACQAFLFGDSFTNMISPALGWTMGALAIAGVPYNKWVKWVIKPLICLVLAAFVVIYLLNTIGWTGL